MNELRKWGADTKDMTVQSAAWARQDTFHDQDGPAMACASVLKPLYAWVAGDNFADAASAAITRSDNEATNLLVSQAGGLARALEGITARTSVSWEPATTWGQVRVRAAELVSAYCALRDSDDPWASEVVGLMRSVVPAQRLGIDGIWERHELPALKAGWDLDDSDTPVLRTLAVVFDAGSAVAVCAATPATAEKAAEWKRVLASQGPEAVLQLQTAGIYDIQQMVRTAVRT